MATKNPLDTLTVARHAKYMCLKELKESWETATSYAISRIPNSTKRLYPPEAMNKMWMGEFTRQSDEWIGKNIGRETVWHFADGKKTFTSIVVMNKEEVVAAYEAWFTPSQELRDLAKAYLIRTVNEVN